mmetsp:Transcript_11579/g.44972  ORF Transcript_11579/g.44972 Transcript_11579/m.44972 type:complete len:253 (+) Transcript_11579:1141-1899(+)
MRSRAVDQSVQARAARPVAARRQQAVASANGCACPGDESPKNGRHVNRADCNEEQSRGRVAGVGRQHGRQRRHSGVQAPEPSEAQRLDQLRVHNERCRAALAGKLRAARPRQRRRRRSGRAKGPRRRGRAEAAARQPAAASSASLAIANDPAADPWRRLGSGLGSRRAHRRRAGGAVGASRGGGPGHDCGETTRLLRLVLLTGFVIATDRPLPLSGVVRAIGLAIVLVAVVVVGRRRRPRDQARVIARREPV